MTQQNNAEKIVDNLVSNKAKSLIDTAINNAYALGYQAAIAEALKAVEQTLLNVIEVMENKKELTTTQRESRKLDAITQCKNALMELECKGLNYDTTK